MRSACYSASRPTKTFELLLVKGADPNAQAHLEGTLLIYMCTTGFAPGAATFILSWPTTDLNITIRPRESLHQFLVQQWTQIEEMLVERGS